MTALHVQANSDEFQATKERPRAAQSDSIHGMAFFPHLANEYYAVLMLLYLKCAISIGNEV